MPVRKVPFVNGEHYHIFNRGVNKQVIFFDTSCYVRALELLEFYTYKAPGIKFSRFMRFNEIERQRILGELRMQNDKLVEVVCFCFMPNHFHFLIKQLEENGVSRFMGNFQNSYTKYVNTKMQRVGHLLQGEFKAVHVENDTQLLHLSRYIHLNPYSSKIVDSIADLRVYPWSSYRFYLNGRSTYICSPTFILSQFINSEYSIFVEDRAAYQQELEYIKHLLIDKK